MQRAAETSSGVSRARGCSQPRSRSAGAPGRAGRSWEGSAPSPARPIIGLAPRSLPVQSPDAPLRAARTCLRWLNCSGSHRGQRKSCECLDYCFRPFQTQKESVVSVKGQKVSSQLLIPLCVLCVCLCIVCFILLMEVPLQ